MKENLDLTKILKDCPKGTKLWHTVYGEVEFDGIHMEEFNSPYLVFFTISTGRLAGVTADGRFHGKYDGECTLFPSKDQRDWSKFKVPTSKVKVTLHPFDKVLGMNKDISDYWEADLLSEYVDEEGDSRYICIGAGYPTVIPYNKDTAYLVGTDENCPIDYEIEFSKEFKEE